MTAHVARTGNIPVNAVGTVLNKSTASLEEMSRASTEIRILYHSVNAPSAVGNPTIEDYIILERAAGYTVVYMDNTTIVTDNTIFNAETPNVNPHDYKLRVQDGLVSGVELWNAMGEFEASGTDAAGEDCCRWADFTPDGPVRLPTPASAGEQMTVISDDDADNGATATGILTARIEYLDASGAQQTEDITLNGTAGVNTLATDIRYVNDFYALSVGSNGVAEGNIAIYKQGSSIALSLYNMIALGGNKSLVPHRMVPAGKKLLLQAWHAEETGDKRCIFRIRSSDINGVLTPGVFLFKDTTYEKKTASGELPLVSKVPALSIVKISAWPDLALAEGACGWWGYLCDSDVDI